nr:multifunctional expression regulator [Mastomys natalensis cytomegalovirus 3]WEG69894.1 multifunctional expression regulator [Mastomys natalensis cytomegalovirus 3]WEG70034.1 multifunctional expression regulator [Mastomys natalensis cytomegalovirus 3]WEG70174.1 multifunctional expression regulator [Mastomys natalensis cytomegalovirus 3]WEG70314.1 multifunctional expression regulator [Mastomys natalensis cytomegalovirus 3]
MQRISVKKRLRPSTDTTDEDVGTARYDRYHHRYGSSGEYVKWKRNYTERCSSSPIPPQYDKNLVTLTHLNKKLDSFGPDDLECLKAMIRVREARERDRRTDSDNDASHSRLQSSPSQYLKDYTTTSLGLCKHPSTLPEPKKQVDSRFSDKTGTAVVSHDELMNTNYLLLYRKHFESMTTEDTRTLMLDRIFSINNAPSLDIVTALADETLSYLKFHRVHNIPVNCDDVYTSTVGLLKYAVFNRLNLADLQCILDGDSGHDKEYQILRQIANKPTTQSRTSASTFEVQRRSPMSFKHPIQQALAIISAFARTIGAIKRRAVRHSGPFFIRNFDDQQIADTYRCGMISELLFSSLRAHRCQNEMCQMKLKKILAPYQVSLFYCPFNNTRRQYNGTYRRDPRYKHRAPDVDINIPKLAYGPNSVSREESRTRKSRHTRHRTHYQRRSASLHDVPSSAQYVPELRLSSTVTSTTAYAAADNEMVVGRETKDTCPTSDNNNDERKNRALSPGECSIDTQQENDSDSSSESSSNSDDEDDGTELEKRSEQLESQLQDTTAFSSVIQDENLGTQCSFNAGETYEETLDPETESVWTASVTPNGDQPPIRQHAPLEDDSDTEFYDPERPLVKRLDTRSCTPSDDVIMECDLSYSEMDSD